MEKKEEKENIKFELFKKLMKSCKEDQEVALSLVDRNNITDNYLLEIAKVFYAKNIKKDSIISIRLLNEFSKGNTLRSLLDKYGINADNFIYE